jgi:hypothetical protein
MIFIIIYIILIHILIFYYYIKFYIRRKRYLNQIFILRIDITLNGN